MTFCAWYCWRADAILLRDISCVTHVARATSNMNDAHAHAARAARIERILCHLARALKTRAALATRAAWRVYNRGVYRSALEKS